MMLAEVRCCCGRFCLIVAGIAVAMEGDRCRDGSLPEEVLPEIPKEELEHAWVGDHRADSLPRDVVRFFRGDNWNEAMLRYVADKINRSAGEAAT